MTVLRREGAGTARILVFRADAVHGAIELGSRVVTIGRGAQNDLVLDDPDRTISRFHAEVRPEDGGYVLVDLGSQNGTWSEEKRVDRVELKRGTPVMIGPYRLIYDDTPLE
jgi:pSer/pThr/pTyr-binding forkhead associated (FHA) protein